MRGKKQSTRLSESQLYKALVYYNLPKELAKTVSEKYVSEGPHSALLHLHLAGWEIVASYFKDNKVISIKRRLDYEPRQDNNRKIMEKQKG